MKPILVLLLTVSMLRAGDNDGQVLQTNGGRFVFGQINGIRGDQYMLDSQTGRLWRIAVDPKTGITYLNPVLYRLVDGSISLNAPDGKYESEMTGSAVPSASVTPSKKASEFLDAK